MGRLGFDSCLLVKGLVLLPDRGSKHAFSTAAASTRRRTMSAVAFLEEMRVAYLFCASKSAGKSPWYLFGQVATIPTIFLKAAIGLMPDIKSEVVSGGDHPVCSSTCSRVLGILFVVRLVHD
mmetsp:Transcript_41936/g.127159  ORF Transcript_41936/g.127159 Transcript_41936/m.127159 type:complete len:122 (-) Transcript_41936:205-570(-)